MLGYIKAEATDEVLGAGNLIWVIDVVTGACIADQHPPVLISHPF